MAYSVELTARAKRDLRHLYQNINAANSKLAAKWLNGLEAAILSLEDNPTPCPISPENKKLRHLLYPSQSTVYRIIYATDERRRLVTIIHIRHGAQEPMGKD
jgi:plasmid stabilization system protein ParE